MRDMIRSIRMLSGEFTRRMISPIILSLLDSLLNSCMYGVMLLVLLDLSGGAFVAENLRRYSFMLLGVFAARCICQAIGFTQAQCLGPDIAQNLRMRLGNHIRSLNLGFFNKNSIGKLSGTLLTDISDFETIITHCLCDVVKVVSFTAFSLVFSFLIDWRFGLAITVLTAIAFPLLLHSGRVSQRNSENMRSANQNAISRIVEYISGIRTFKLYNLVGSRFERLDSALDDMRIEATRAEISILPSALSFSAITSMILPVALIMGTWLLTAQNFETASFIIVLLLAISVTSILSTLSSLYPQVRSITKAADNILDVLKQKPLPYEEDSLDSKNGEVELKNISFCYTQDTPVLRNISFIAKPGTTTALIGPSGSGKTTIVSLIARFWDANEGSITVGGTDIRSVSPDALTQKMSIVFQDVYLLNDTVMNNIKVGRPCATNEEVFAASKSAHCHDFITAMEQGYDTMVGEGGSTLSGGEKQRISIARALLKDAPIVLLDETTSSLDAGNEREIQQAFDTLMKDKTVLVIAHRLNTILHADNILVLDKGEIKEAGSHTQLMEKHGWYAHMVQEQNAAKNWKVKGE